MLREDEVREKMDFLMTGVFGAGWGNALIWELDEHRKGHDSR